MGNALGTPPSGPNRLPRGEHTSEKEASKRRNFTLNELSSFDGTEGTPIYISIRSEVFDATSSADLFGAGGEYRRLAGTDATLALATGRLDDSTINNVDDVELRSSEQNTLADWEMRFQDEARYPKVGRLVIHQDLTANELRKFNGVDNMRGTVLVALNGTIFDVTLNGLEHYGPEGSYSQFAGRDASRALACMSLDDEYLDDPRLDDLSDTQRSSLSDWATRFQQKYTAVGRLTPS